MQFRFFRGAALAATLPFLAAPALADVTAEDVRANWMAMAESLGQTVSVGEERRDGDTLTLRDTTVTMDAENGTVAGLLGELAMEETGDGRVRITMSPESVFEFRGTAAEGEEVATTVRIAFPGHGIVASGDPGAVHYDYDMPRLTVSVDALSVDDEPLELAMTLAAETVRGEYSFAQGPQPDFSHSFASDRLSMAMNVDPEAEDEVAVGFDMTMRDVAATGTGIVTSFPGGRALAAFLRNGMAGAGSFSSGASEYRIEAIGPDGPVLVEGGAAQGAVDYTIGPDGVRYAGETSGMEISVTAPQPGVPPMSFAIGETAGELRFPLVASEEEQGFGLALRLAGVEVAEALWSMIDPGGAIPRDPAELAVELSGRGRLDVDLADSEALETAAEAGPPGELRSVEIERLRLSLAGAELAGDGAFTFDNSVMPPAPSGQVDLSLSGANALLDTLVRIGLLPEDQAMGARMMLGLFAMPGNGPDELVSAIEVNPDGSILANGQRIR